MSADVVYLFAQHKHVPVEQAHDLRSHKSDMGRGYLIYSLYSLSALISCLTYLAFFYALRGLLI
jgi:hypothetical protein